MKTPGPATIYARNSSDATGEGPGIQRQLEDCRKLATALNWTFADEYVDNDILAYRAYGARFLAV